MRDESLKFQVLGFKLQAAGFGFQVLGCRLASMENKHYGFMKVSDKLEA